MSVSKPSSFDLHLKQQFKKMQEEIQYLSSQQSILMQLELNRLFQIISFLGSLKYLKND